VRRGRPRGFSLLEVLSAMTLFALVASAIGALATGSMRHTIRNRHATAAAMLAQQRLEDLRALAYADIAGGTSTATVGGQSFSVGTSVLADAPGANMKTITVTVSWTGPEGTRSYAVQTIYTAVTS